MSAKMSYILRINRRPAILLLGMAIVTLVFLADVRGAHASYCKWNGISPINCLKDFKVPNGKPADYPTCTELGGFCMNQVCHCNEVDPGFCQDEVVSPPVPRYTKLCYLMPHCYSSGTCGPFTVALNGNTAHVTNCRCVNGYPGGCQSYCQNPPAPVCATAGQACTTLPNKCGMTNSGTIDAGTCACNVSKPDDSLCATPTGELARGTPLQNCTKLAGWASDADYNGPIPVEFWVSVGVKGIPSHYTTLTANQPYTGHDTHGFSLDIPQNWHDGTTRTIQVSAIDVKIDGTRTTGPHPQVAGSPLTLTCPPPPTVTIAAAPASINQGQTTIIKWTSTNAASCTSTGGDPAWPKTRIGAGNYVTPALSNTTTYGMTCVNALGESASASTTVTVIPVPPTVTLSPIVGHPDYCVSGSPDATLSWTYSSTVGLTQAQFELQIAAANNFPNSVIYTSPWRNGGNTTTNVGAGVLAFGPRYWVRVKVRDTQGAESAWSNAVWFDTPNAAYPRIILTAQPSSPPANVPVTLTDETVYGGDIPLSRVWTFGDGSADVTGDPGPGTVDHTYGSEGSYSSTLTVQTSVMQELGDACTATVPISAKKAVPQFKEVRP